MKCPKCGNIIFEPNEVVSVANGYSYYCNHCDEDLYSFEVEDSTLDEQLTLLIELTRADEHFATLSEQGIEMDKDRDAISERFYLSSTTTEDILKEMEEMINNICKYIKQGDANKRFDTFCDITRQKEEELGIFYKSKFNNKKKSRYEIYLYEEPYDDNISDQYMEFLTQFGYVDGFNPNTRIDVYYNIQGGIDTYYDAEKDCIYPSIQKKQGDDISEINKYWIQ